MTQPYTHHLLQHVRVTIGQNIQRQRVKKQMTLAKLSRLTGVPETLLDHYELGKNRMELEALLRITCALGLPLGKALG